MDDLTTRIQRYADNLIAAYPDVTPGEVMAVRGVPTRLRPVLVAAVAAVIVLLAVGGFALLLGHSDTPVVEPVTTTLPALATTTTTGSTTTIPQTAAAPTISWNRVESPLFDDKAGLWAASAEHIGSAFYLTGSYDGEDGTGGAIWRSEDGYSWERFDDPTVFGGSGLINIMDIAGNDTILVAVGLDYMEDPDFSSMSAANDRCVAALWVSEDNGHTWARVPDQDAFGMEGRHWMSTITATHDGFIAAGSDLWRSPDGLRWTLIKPLNGSDVRDIAVVPSGIVAVGEAQGATQGNRAVIWWSPDGTDWNRISEEASQFPVGEGLTSWLRGVLAVNQDYVTVGTAGPFTMVNASVDAAVWVSSNGREWRRVEQTQLRGARQEGMNGITASGDLLVAVGDSTNVYQAQHDEDVRSVGVVWVSRDAGATWSTMDDPGHVFGLFLNAQVSIQDVTSTGNLLVAAGYDRSGAAVWVGIIEKGDG